ncbi:MAG: hypothetical protein A2528_02155 [Candidatus Staskawiczbacteria bacterium RIFOXYD2_FULL_37_9]|uniref:M23ase beta-sheet core domain-containing protein n=1 Tax=Candidatus Staskawiczbacteria bacterium RIFOXYB1_FULL_37_44 TaxID=1802223 RepID=A0A1G2IVT3_9BACT|nr:MAG: hypothetical protein A2358_02610 [Candidatus Staskawiczbacteria bacterium RIFOXYB1_FULL_37_44]OGZ84276.1 MAG: hypothetical protein A2416_01350 [Candidatus Staskawiczbacteria bacterium RIFOXYC1_FULL_37_52]OGZ89069.1 MAG: hypothetical protein A2581_00885 [Candidatus Staskawiczbacteria bacterium RIFOXYD1_FULL_37_110]OGZ89446.1 MAG: hypothetical protein A2444_04085 [Candidatus Staskawiczbacteria bacterium RIFOXYC2_FULL_37_19]OGZ93867.1 MAG: hypothetical protein A2528_02155 [Candidatus Stask
MLELHYPTINILGQILSLNDTSNFPEYARYFFNIGIILAGLIAVGTVIFGGVYYLISFAKGSFKDEGKDQLKAGITGLLIVMCAYLIAFTINPDLVVFKLGKLTPSPLKDIAGNNIPPGVNFTSYQEIPIGTLTETLLTRTMNSCYAFDAAGNPVIGSQKTDDGKDFAPTYLNHDRADCLLQLADGAQKKGQVIAALSSEINKLMSECDCQKYGKCDDTCGGAELDENGQSKGCDAYSGVCPAPEGTTPTCSGACVPDGSPYKGACKTPIYKDAPKDCCPTGVKDKIEHGPIKVSQECNSQLTWYTVYGHMDKLYVSAGQKLYKGQSIGEVGEVGTNIGPHLHFAVGFPTGGSNIYQIAISFDISSLVSAPGGKIGSRDPGTIAQPLPPDATQDKLNFIKSTLSSPLNNGFCKWKEVFGSILHSQGAYYAQDWECNANKTASDKNSTESATVFNMSGGNNIESTVFEILQGEGGVVIEHKVVDSHDNNPPKTNNDLNIGGATTCQSSDPSKPGYCSGAVGICIGNTCAPLGGGEGGGSSSSCNACNTPANNYAGLDEFRCPNNRLKFNQCSGIAGLVEKQTQLNGKTITVIDSKKWNQLNLAQQLTYFKEKMESIKNEIKKDANKLTEAKTTLGRCYLAMPYVDLLKTYQKTDQKSKIILINKTFKDPLTNSVVSATKYCKGFNYGNSNCLKKCNDMCPDTSSEAIEDYAECTDPKTQEACIEEAFYNRPCADADVENPPDNFGECIDLCQNDCSNICAKQYLPNSNEFKTCQEQCKNDSKCVLDNADTCLFGAEGFNNCATQITDQGNINHCISNAYLCKNGSDEYAGYPDCARPASAKCADGQYSSSFLYKSFFDNYPGCEKCPYPLNSLIEGGPACEKIYPETAKCPSSSYCPNCPCGKIDQNFRFCIPNESDKNNAGDEGSAIITQKVLAYEITSPQCNEYAFNDDPLTFYCEDSWWTDPNKEGNNPTPIGTERICEKSGEVPVGQTVDGAENWANNLIASAEKINKNIQKIFDNMQKAGKAKNTQPVQDYCKCNAKFENKNPICKTDCKFNQEDIPVYDGNGEPTGETQTQCSCAFTSCQGNPCEQVINYLSDIWNSFRQFKINFIDFYTTMIQEPRSDIIKQLAYSRQQTNSCSLVNNAYNTKAKLFNCTWAEHQIISPISNSKTILNGVTYDGCYGGQNDGHLGKRFNLTDNWFCCQEYSKNPVQRN